METLDDVTPLLVDPLTNREHEILLLLAQRLSNQEIADQLFLSLNTVKWYTKRLFSKLGVSNRVEAVTQARESMLLPPDASGSSLLSGLQHHLPEWTTQIIGRERELMDLSSLFWDERVRLVTLLALGGMGKTCLALAFAKAWGARFRDGVFFVPLASLVRADHFVLSLAECIGYQFEPDLRSSKRQLLDFLSSKNALIILDNFEHLLEASPVISELLQTAPNLRILVTSRERLNLQTKETVYKLEGLSYPAHAHVNDVCTYSAVELFVQAARRVQPSYVPHDMEIIIQLCQLVQGMPLAIVLAASRIAVLSLVEIITEIERSFDFLRTDMRDLPDRLCSIRTVFEWSWQRLTEGEQTTFRRWIVFRSSPTREAVEAVTGASLESLSGLIDKALLCRNSTTGRYDVHELLRQGVTEKFEASGEVKAVREAFIHYYLRMLHEHPRDVQGHRQLDTVPEITEDIKNISQALRWAVQYWHYDLAQDSVQPAVYYQ